MIYASPHPPIAVPATTVHESILARMDSIGEREVVLDGDTTRSGRATAHAVRVFAGRLARAGVAPGDVVALAAPNSAEWLVATLGALAAGAAVTTSNPALPAPMAAAQLTACGARLVVTAAQNRSWAQAVAGPDGLPVRELDGVFADDGEPADPVTADPETTAVLLHSSGTTGLPKAVMLSHRALVAGSQAIRGATGRMGTDETVLVALPLFHAGGLSIALAALSHGARLVIRPGFDLPDFLGAVARHRVTFTLVVPPIAMALARHPAVDQFDTSSLQAVYSTAAPMGAELETDLTDRLGCTVGQGYAMSEGVPFTLSRPDSPHHRPGTVGVPAPNTEIRLVEPAAGRDAAPGQPGELWIRGPQLMSGYLDDPAATTAAMDAAGWLRSGDLCSVDEHGVVTVLDRIKELIKTNGMQVPPAVLESTLLGHPAVADCAVVARPHETAGEVPVGYVVPAPGVVLEPEDVMAFVTARVPRYMRLAHVVAVEAIPRNPTGKVLRRVLRDRERALEGSS